MTMATLANIWRYRFHSLNESDHSNVLDGIEFLVQYVGCTAITGEDCEMASDTQIDEFFSSVVSNYQESRERLLFKLLLNRNGAVICNSEGDIQHSFEANNISYVTTTSCWKYSKYVIIVARTRLEQSLKGHVLFCKNKSNAKRICETFTELFKMAGSVTIVTEDKEACTEGEVKTRSRDVNSNFVETGTRRTFDPDGLPTEGLNKHTVCSINTSMSFDDHQPAKSEELVDGFTELARSRSSSSTPPLSSGNYFGEDNPPYQFDDPAFIKGL